MVTVYKLSEQRAMGFACPMCNAPPGRSCRTMVTDVPTVPHYVRTKLGRVASGGRFS